ncbi:PREDICTED: keratinocyte proline-rich protein-like [Chinchilla lanigera]|uniref:keratinocyte proline-rich protein-like n=1 Tax=Chinchilla lanigera TaxID=34839 RepID=UPI00038EDD53|nr:PREDICTED: keratinocyte proline-rich protein-like [Chinchilla lanigera]
MPLPKPRPSGSPASIPRLGRACPSGSPASTPRPAPSTCTVRQAKPRGLVTPLGLAPHRRLRAEAQVFWCQHWFPGWMSQRGPPCPARCHGDQSPREARPRSFPPSPGGCPGGPPGPCWPEIVLVESLGFQPQEILPTVHPDTCTREEARTFPSYHMVIPVLSGGPQGQPGHVSHVAVTRYPFAPN